MSFPLRLSILFSILFFLAVKTIGATNVARASHGDSAVATHHSLSAQLDLAKSEIRAVDAIKFQTPTSSTNFYLNKNLQITSVSNGVLKKISGGLSAATIATATAATTSTAWSLNFSSPVTEVQISYNGVINEPILNGDTLGFVNTDGVVLYEGSYWYPAIENSLLTFDLTTNIVYPTGTAANMVTLSQGDYIDSAWVENHPQTEINLIIGRYNVYKAQNQGIEYQVLLKQDDSILAKKYLDIMPTYTNEFSSRIAPYPYKKFVAVENFWESGLGMPSFTLLGPSVMRLPFILYSSLPHEILHNWWGNSVFVDYQSGNWCEGLTTYMADHDRQKQQGKDAIFRMAKLVEYMDYAASGADFPLRKFVGRTDASTQAVGYGKSMMFFNMLKTQFGDDLFTKAIQKFYQDNMFQQASFDDIRKAFESVTRQNLQSVFLQWLDQTGAPIISLSGLTRTNTQIQFSLQQTNSNKDINFEYDLYVPARLTYQDQTQDTQILNLNSRQQSFAFNIASGKIPKKLEIDFSFDVFRILDSSEKPATISNFLSASSFEYWHESSENSALAMVESWSKDLNINYNQKIIDAAAILPQSGVLIVSGNSAVTQNLLSPLVSEANDRVKVTSNQLLIDGKSYLISDRVIVLTLKLSSRPDLTVVWLLGPSQVLTANLAQRIQHYGNLTALIFDASQSTGAPIPNMYKEVWTPAYSVLKRDL